MTKAKGIGSLDPSYLNSISDKKWTSKILRWISTVEQTPEQTDEHIPSRHDGYIYPNPDIGGKRELYCLADSIQIITGNEDISNDLYSTSGLKLPNKLRPLDDLSFLNTCNMLTIQSAEFYALDVLSTEAITEQNQTVNNIVLSTNNTNIGGKDYVSTGFYNTIPVSWQPNFFNPKILINGEDVLGYNKTGLGNKSNRGDLSIGHFLPFYVDIYQTFKESISSLEIKALAGQLVKNGTETWLLRYPIICQALIIYS